MTQATPTGPPPAPDAMEKRRRTNGKILKIFGAIGAVFLVLLIIGAITSNDDDNATSQKAAGSPKTTSAPTTKSAAAPQTLEERLKAHLKDRYITSTEAAGNVLIQFKVGDNLTPNMIKTMAQRDTIDLLKIVHETAPKLDVTIRGDFPLKDQYGNESDQAVLLLNYKAATLDKINYENVEREMIWGLSEPSPKRIHPQLAG